MHSGHTFCTCHDSGAVVTYVNLWPYGIFIFQVWATWIFTIFLLWVHKTFAKWVPVALHAMSIKQIHELINEILQTSLRNSSLIIHPGHISAHIITAQLRKMLLKSGNYFSCKNNIHTFNNFAYELMDHFLNCSQSARCCLHYVGALLICTSWFQISRRKLGTNHQLCWFLTMSWLSHESHCAKRIRRVAIKIFRKNPGSL